MSLSEKARAAAEEILDSSGAGNHMLSDLNSGWMAPYIERVAREFAEAALEYAVPYPCVELYLVNDDERDEYIAAALKAAEEA